MKITHPWIEMAERFGVCCDEGVMVCLFCDSKLREDSEKGVVDRFGRCFCSEKCKKIYYGKDRKFL